MDSLVKLLKYAGIVVLIAIIVYVGYSLGSRSRANEIAELTLKIAQREKTVEVQKGLYATTIVQLNGLTKLLDSSRDEVKLLKKQLDDAQAQLLTTQQLVIKWKKAYEGELAANQSSDPPTDPASPERKRVTFSGLLGPIQVNGYTITDPPEAHVKIQQTKPVILTVSVAKNKDGTWTSYATSSDDNIDVQVSLAGVDTGILSTTWKQRLWVNAGIDVLGDKSASLGLSYHWDRVSFGVRCSTSFGCGADLGFRIFK